MQFKQLKLILIYLFNTLVIASAIVNLGFGAFVIWITWF